MLAVPLGLAVRVRLAVRVGLAVPMRLVLRALVVPCFDVAFFLLQRNVFLLDVGLLLVLLDLDLRVLILRKQVPPVLFLSL